MNRLGIEWIYRLLQEPRRMWRRYILGNPAFLARIVAERVGPARPFEPSTRLNGAWMISLTFLLPGLPSRFAVGLTLAQTGVLVSLIPRECSEVRDRHPLSGRA